ncbi:serine/threonine-protein phosphatase [Streptomyces albidoflavus]|nr:Serine phosphatase RsbU, regulator of sigma subunit [Streptomyces sp. PVA_94-07]RWZ75771.1 serine/threonine-protein phosphatase [Streptomyces albidoflavus]
MNSRDEIARPADRKDPAVDRIGRRWPAYAGVVPWALLVLGIVMDLATPREVSGGPLIVLACVASGVIMSFRATLRLVLVAFVAELLTGFWESGTAGAQQFVDLAYVVVAGALGLDLNRLVIRYGRRITEVRTVAESVQLALLPEPPVRLAGYDIAASYRAAQTEARIGGDLYAVHDSPWGLRVFIGDVRGKGMGAVSTVALLLGAFREAAEDVPTLEALGARLDRRLAREAPGLGEELEIEGFTTAVLAEFPHGGGVVRLLNFGHPGPYLLAGGHVRGLDAEVPNLPLGMSGFGQEVSPHQEFAFPPGSSLLFVTDGVTESRNPEGVFFDPVRGLEGMSCASAKAAVNSLLTRVDAWTGGVSTDDRAVLAVAH